MKMTKKNDLAWTTQEDVMHNNLKSTEYVTG
jgi:hypothetical protein